jgi:hypothetical protein
MPVPVRLRTVFAVTAALAAVLVPSLSVQQASAATTCDISGKERRLGATYVTALTVRKVSCGKAEKVVKAYHRCRFDAGGKDGKCSRRVQGGWSCSDRRFNKIPTQYDGRATCKKGSARIWHSYTQFT